MRGVIETPSTLIRHCGQELNISGNSRKRFVQVAQELKSTDHAQGFFLTYYGTKTSGC